MLLLQKTTWRPFLIDDEFPHNIVKAYFGLTRLRPDSHFDNVVTQFIINKKTDA